MWGTTYYLLTHQKWSVHLRKNSMFRSTEEQIDFLSCSSQGWYHLLQLNNVKYAQTITNKCDQTTGVALIFSHDAAARDFLRTCCESPLRDVWLTRRMTSPTLMRPLSAAGWPGNSFLTRTMLEPEGSSRLFSSRLKLKPSPDVFFSRQTLNTLSVETNILYFKNSDWHQVRCGCVTHVINICALQ